MFVARANSVISYIPRHIGVPKWYLWKNVEPVMHTTVIDTLRYANSLKEAGVDPRQAEAMSRAINNELTEGVATKRDLDDAVVDLKGEISRLDSRFDALEAGLDVKFEALDSKFEAKFEALDSKFEAKFEALDSKIESLEVRSPRLEVRSPRLKVRSPRLKVRSFRF